MKNRTFAIQWHHTIRIILTLILFSMVNLTISAILGIVYIPILENYGIYLPAPIIVPSIFIIIIYPILIMPIVESKFRQPLSRKAILLQALAGLFVFPPLAILTEIGIVHLAKFASPLSVVPIVGEVVKLGKLSPSILFGLIMVATAIAAVLGIWSSLILYWSVQKVRS